MILVLPQIVSLLLMVRKTVPAMGRVNEISPFRMICYRFTNGRFRRPLKTMLFSPITSKTLATERTSTGTERITKSASDSFLFAPASTTPKANASCK
jgi:hypothetical protein